MFSNETLVELTISNILGIKLNEELISSVCESNILLQHYNTILYTSTLL